MIKVTSTMAESPVYSSQDTRYEQYQILPDQENLASSPLKDRSSRLPPYHNQKPRALPTVTPKRFTKFFTPRLTASTRGRKQSKASRQLRDITKSGANRRRNARPLKDPVFVPAEDTHLSQRPPKRRKYSIDASSSPPQSSPLKHFQTADQSSLSNVEPVSTVFSDDEVLEDMLDKFQPFPQPVKRFRQNNRTQRILQRSFGGSDATTRGWRGSDHCSDWLADTADFVSTPADIHPFTGSALPFCAASCNTNSLIAIGEEEGSVRLIDSSSSSDFNRAHVTFRPHHNAVMDVAFSSDDYRLATASGDQTSRVIDMHTQATICIFSGHKSSVKQVRFQPNDDDILTTSSRDGSVLMWDLRCGGKGSVASLRTSFARNVNYGDAEPTVRFAKYTLDAGLAHRSTKASPVGSSDVSGVSITSIQHLPNGREHLLLTTSELNSSIKIWDLRNASRRGGLATPLSSVPIPETQSWTRNYGISAVVFSGDGARLYAACRDGIVYAYSSNHLALGSVPELSSSDGKARMLKTPKSGLGPLYGFKHPALRMGSFYIKAAVRPARGDKSEMLAVGSSDNCTVLFPTDERHLLRREPPFERCDEGGESEEAELPSLPATSSPMSKTGPKDHGLDVHEHGTALLRGHTKEVTSLSWSKDSELVTVSDDFTVRCWREHGERARELRGCGEGGGRRWGCGWADVDSVWDEEEA